MNYERYSNYHSGGAGRHCVNTQCVAPLVKERAGINRPEGTHHERSDYCRRIMLTSKAIKAQIVAIIVRAPVWQYQVLMRQFHPLRSIDQSLDRPVRL